MKIDRVILKNIRCFDELEIKLGGKSAIIIGDNGDGKSTIIRSLAMGLCDDSSAAALFRELHGETVRKGPKNDGRIEVYLRDRASEFRTVTEIKSLETFERVQQEVFQRSLRAKRFRTMTQMTFPWHRIFAAAYGAGIRVQGTEPYNAYLLVDAVYPLFRYDAALQNPELVVRRLVDAARWKGGEKAADTVLTSILTLLQTVLQLDDPYKVELTRTGLTVRGPWGRSELSSLGDGYRSTVTWILDLVSWWFLRRSNASRTSGPTDIRGIVLIDELEQHLHPKWQRNIMRLLTVSFPNVQFIATTHSPLVASGCKDIPVHRLNRVIRGVPDVVFPFGWLAEDVYEMMGLPSSRAEKFVEVLNKYQHLDEKRLQSKLSKTDRLRLIELQRQIATLPGDDPVSLTTELENLARRAKELSEPS